MEEGKPAHAEMARQLDSMERDVTSWEASFLDSVLKCLRGGRPLGEKRENKLEEMWDKYLGPEAARADEEDAGDAEDGE